MAAQAYRIRILCESSKGDLLDEDASFADFVKGSFAVLGKTRNIVKDLYVDASDLLAVVCCWSSCCSRAFEDVCSRVGNRAWTAGAV